MKKIGFLSFGHWTPSPQSQTQSAADTLLQSIDLAVEAERLGMDGAYFRVHHFARQLASPLPLLSAIGAKTRKIEIGTAVIDIIDDALKKEERDRKKGHVSNAD
jgi:alkanesulfonate monooxygenase SsuD/methylene tetrahydromethanopterin reductase-like flavin-dependent oxidoreductase (luciferase family)